MKSLPTLAAVLCLVLAAAVPGRAQDLAQTGVLESRAELEQLLAELNATAGSSAYSDGLRDRARAEARLIEARLRDGDFRVGDRIYLQVSLQGRPFLSDTLRVVQGPSVYVGEIGEVELDGVLRSELPDHMADYLGRFVRDPSLDQVSTFVRLSFVGAVAEQGERYLPAESLIGEALNVGGVGTGADLEGVTIQRGGETLWDEEAVRLARREGRTLDQMSLQAGDEIQVPAGSPGTNWVTVLQVGVGILTSVAIFFQVFN